MQQEFLLNVPVLLYECCKDVLKLQFEQTPNYEMCRVALIRCAEHEVQKQKRFNELRSSLQHMLESSTGSQQIYKSQSSKSKKDIHSLTFKNFCGPHQLCTRFMQGNIEAAQSDEASPRVVHSNLIRQDSLEETPEQYATGDEVCADELKYFPATFCSKPGFK